MTTNEPNLGEILNESIRSFRRSAIANIAYKLRTTEKELLVLQERAKELKKQLDSAWKEYDKNEFHHPVKISSFDKELNSSSGKYMEKLEYAKSRFD